MKKQADRASEPYQPCFFIKTSSTHDSETVYVYSPHMKRLVSSNRYIFHYFLRENHFWLHLFYSPGVQLEPKTSTTRGADKSLTPPGRKQATATEDFDVHIPYLLSQLEEY